MFQTVEVRWFYPGEIPSKAQIWIEGLAVEIITEAPREDYYLINTGEGKFGIKLRQLHLEIKEQEQIYGFQHLSTEVSGIIEGWNKIIFPPFQEEPKLLNNLQLSTSWVGVKKTRWLGQIRYDQFASETKTTIDDYGTGCNIELTKIKLNNQLWWSIGLEAYGADNQNYNRLIDGARQVFISTNAPILSGQHSFGYPKWLDKII